MSRRVEPAQQSEVAKTRSPTTCSNIYVASGAAMLYLKNVVGTTTSKTIYLYAGSLLIATVSGTTYSYFHADALGDTRLVTQKSGGSAKSVFASNYEPFGVAYGASGTDPSVKYTGQWSEAADPPRASARRFRSFMSGLSRPLL